jgi:hypothetical protein
MPHMSRRDKHRRGDCGTQTFRGDPHDGTGLGERVVPKLETCRLCEEQALHYTLAVAFGEPAGKTSAFIFAVLVRVCQESLR